MNFDDQIEIIKRTPVTSVLMVISIVVSIPIILAIRGVPSAEKSANFIMYLFLISTNAKGFLSEVFNGQVYRLITPIFLHFGILHILFNMMCFKDLGRLIELRLNSNILMALVIVTGILSNLAQYVFGQHNFGGMSGVIFGLVGYLYIQQKYNPRFGVFVPKESFVMVTIWFIICVVGIIPNVANYAHGGGLIVGALLGLMDVKFNILPRFFNKRLDR